TASCAPVEAPDGTAALPCAPPISRTSTCTVGLPRESRISRAVTSSMVVISLVLFGICYPPSLKNLRSSIRYCMVWMHFALFEMVRIFQRLLYLVEGGESKI